MATAYVETARDTFVTECKARSLRLNAKLSTTPIAGITKASELLGWDLTARPSAAKVTNWTLCTCSASSAGPMQIFLDLAARNTTLDLTLMRCKSTGSIAAIAGHEWKRATSLEASS